MKIIFALLLITFSALAYFIFANSRHMTYVADSAPSPQEEIVSPLPQPPSTIQAIYFTKYSAASEKKITYLIDLARHGLINAVVIDFKDYTGMLSYSSSVALAVDKKLSDPIVKDVKELVKKLHHENIYVIARISVFQDLALVKAVPEFGVQSKARHAPWRDRKGIAWLDVSNPQVWDYIIAIAKELRGFGIDEMNFDYIRFPSDGLISDTEFRYWDGKTPKHAVIKFFITYLKQQLAGIPLSFDIFGQSLVNKDDVNIGQLFENFLFDGSIISPMVYPSHYVSGFIGYKNPADHPYEVIKYSLDTALSRIEQAAAKSSTTLNIKMRPWLQYFDLGAIYNPEMVAQEVRAVNDSFATTSYYQGYNFWDPANSYKSIQTLP